jgi:hypothetical protein
MSRTWLPATGPPAFSLTTIPERVSVPVKSGGLEHAVRTAPRASRARVKAFLITLPPLKP